MTFFLSQIQSELQRIIGIPVVRPSSIAEPDEHHITIRPVSGLTIYNQFFEEWNGKQYNTIKEGYEIEVELKGSGYDEIFEDQMGELSKRIAETFIFSVKIPFVAVNLDEYIFNTPTISGDAQNQISNFRIKGLLDDYNSNENKYLYWNLQKTNEIIKLTFYRDSAKTIRVLEGETTASGTMNLSGEFKFDSSEENWIFNSGLSATCSIDYVEDDTDSENLLTVENNYFSAKPGFGIVINFEPKSDGGNFEVMEKGKSQYTFSQKWKGSVIIYTANIKEVR
ncbi:MAG: hypothetical protein EOM23_07070 [Candidatus Moranbacteria bacterium]|nr:hypothetical protein [Candidatus Moranbacteria bacterium]